LRKLYGKGKATNTYTLMVKQDELAEQLGMSRQALNVHLKILKERDYIRTDRGFVEITDIGLKALGITTTPAFILLKVSPVKRMQIYDKVKELSISRAYRIAGELDVLIMVERENLDEILKKLYTIDGIQDTRSSITIETVKKAPLILEHSPLKEWIRSLPFLDKKYI